MGVKSTGSHPTTTKADGHLLEYFRNTMGAGGGANAGPSGFIDMEASGGVIADYESGGTQYRTHTFTTSGTFEITQNSSGFSDAAKIDVFLIAGGGAGGGGNSTYGGGGGGAGGGIEVTAYPARIATYPITIGSGGATDVAAGTNHICYIESDAVNCTGDNSDGQTTVPALTAPQSVYAGADWSCAGLSDGSYTCWGSTAGW